MWALKHERECTWKRTPLLTQARAWRGYLQVLRTTCSRVHSCWSRVPLTPCCSSQSALIGRVSKSFVCTSMPIYIWTRCNRCVYRDMTSLSHITHTAVRITYEAEYIGGNMQKMVAPFDGVMHASVYIKNACKRQFVRTLCKRRTPLLSWIASIHIQHRSPWSIVLCNEHETLLGQPTGITCVLIA